MLDTCAIDFSITVSDLVLDSLTCLFLLWSRWPNGEPSEPFNSAEFKEIMLGYDFVSCRIFTGKNTDRTDYLGCTWCIPKKPTKQWYLFEAWLSRIQPSWFLIASFKACSSIIQAGNWRVVKGKWLRAPGELGVYLVYPSPHNQVIFFWGGSSLYTAIAEDQNPVLPGMCGIDACQIGTPSTPPRLDDKLNKTKSLIAGVINSKK